MAQQYIFQMQGLTKAYPGGKKVFENKIGRASCRERV